MAARGPGNAPQGACRARWHPRCRAGAGRPQDPPRTRQDARAAGRAARGAAMAAGWPPEALRASRRPLAGPAGRGLPAVRPLDALRRIRAGSDVEQRAAERPRLVNGQGGEDLLIPDELDRLCGSPPQKPDLDRRRGAGLRLTGLRLRLVHDGSFRVGSAHCNPLRHGFARGFGEANRCGFDACNDLRSSTRGGARGTHRLRR